MKSTLRTIALLAALAFTPFASCAPPTTGQFLFQRKTTGPFDQFGVTPLTGQAFGWNGSAVVMLPVSSGGTWGSITGTLSNQTDLQTALNAKGTVSSVTGATLNGVTISFNGSATAPTITSITLGDITPNSVAVSDTFLANDTGLSANGTITFNSKTLGLGSNFATSGNTFTTNGFTYTLPGANKTLLATDGAMSGGTINNSVIGGVTPAAGTFTSLATSQYLTFTNNGHRIKQDGGTFYFESSGASGVPIYAASLTVDQGVTTQNGYPVTASGGLVSSGGTLQLNDTILLRDGAADTLAMRRGANAQTLNLYGTYTDGSNYERLRIYTAPDEAYLRAEAAGSGGFMGLNLESSYGGGIKISDKITVSGNTIFTTDNTYDIGAGGANRPRNVYVADSAFLGSALVAGNNVSIGSNVSLRPGTTTGDLLITEQGAIGTPARIQLGGTTASFPSIKRNGAGIDFRLADDSAAAAISASVGSFTSDASYPVVVSGLGGIKLNPSNGYGEISFFNNGTWTTSGLGWRPSGAGANGHLFLYANGMDALTLWPNGRVGIGLDTVAPDEALHVVGNAKVTGTLNGNNVNTKIYRALLSQTGTSAPTATVLENTLGGAVVLARSATGNYTATLVAAFPENKLFWMHTAAIAEFSRSSADVCTIVTRDGAGVDSDDILFNTPLQIIVYP